MQTYGAVDAAPTTGLYLRGTYPGGRETIAFVLHTPALLQAARKAGHWKATRAAQLLVPPSDGEVDGIGMCTECATAYTKTKRLTAGRAGG